MSAPSTRLRRMVIPPRMSKHFPSVEFSVHQVSNSFRASDVATVFPDINTQCLNQPLFCVVTFQEFNFSSPSQEAEASLIGPSLIGVNSDSVEFKDVSRDKFFAFMEHVKSQVTSTFLQQRRNNDGDDGVAWVNWTDPATGIPVSGAVGPSIYSEGDAIEQLMAYELVLVAGSGGGCRMVKHPRWGVNVYPVTGFISVPSAEMVTDIFADI